MSHRSAISQSKHSLGKISTAQVRVVLLGISALLAALTLSSCASSRPVASCGGGDCKAIIPQRHVAPPRHAAHRVLEGKEVASVTITPGLVNRDKRPGYVRDDLLFSR